MMSEMLEIQIIQPVYDGNNTITYWIWIYHENTKGVIRSCNSKKRKDNGKWDTHYKSLSRKLKIEPHEPDKKTGVNSGSSEEKAVPVLPILLRSC